MRVMIDTNVIISAMVFKSAKMCGVLKKIIEEHELCMSAYAISEAKHILSDKFAGTENDVAVFFEDYPYTLIDVSPDVGEPLFHLRDVKDYPVLYAAIISQVDILVTGDKDFFEVKIDRPEILSPLDFLAKYPTRL